MFRKLIFLVSLVLVLGLINSSKAGQFSFKLDLGLEGHQVPEGFCEISGGPGSSPEPWIVNNVCGSGIDVTLETTWPDGDTLGFRDNGFHPLFGDCIFVDNHPDCGVVVTVSGLAPGSYAFTGYHNNIWGVVGGEFDVYVDGDVVITGLRQTGIGAGGDFNDVTTSNLIFTIAEGENSVEFMFTPPSPNEPNDIVVNGFIIEQYDITVARNPRPPDGAENIEPNVVLSWTPGEYTQDVNGHDVYFGTDFNDVNEATTSSPEYKGPQDRDVNSYDPNPGGGLLDLGQTYYWRINEVNDPNKWTGYVWSFTVKPGKAYNPSPADGIWTVATDANLVWTAGALATSHDVYFGTDPCDLDLVSPGQAATSYNPGPLGSGQNYYWRIDEHGPSGDFPGDLWSFTTVGGMILHYKFDETDGTTAADFSGHGLDGTVEEPHWGPEGHLDGCLGFEYETYVSSSQRLFSNIGREVTVAVWVNGDDGDGTNYLFTVHFGVDQFTRAIGARVPRHYAPGDPNVHFIAGKEPEDFVMWPGGEGEDWQGEWNHYAFVKDEIEQTLRIHHNGVRVAEKIGGTLDTLYLFRGRGLFIGRGWSQFHDHYEGRQDDFRIYDYALSDLEIAQLFRGGDLGLAWNPEPEDGAVGIAQDVVLSWLPGDYAIRHDVYFGTDFDDVNDANTSSAVYKGRQDPCEYDPCGLLDLETTYFWRIDEVNGPCTWPGKIWRFTTTNYILLDDMESYCTGVGCDNEILDTWLDGFTWPPINYSGSEVALGAAPIDPVHGGKQSMVYLYDNCDSWGWGLDYYSEMEVAIDDLPIGPDWTAGGVKALILYFYGQAGNDANATEQLYVGLEDSTASGHYTQVDYGAYGEDNNDLRLDEWSEWIVPLSDFSDGGVILTAVDKIYLGFGIRGNPNPGGTPGGTGTVYFDDLRLSLPKCVPSRGPAADLSGDCLVSIEDVGVMGEEWLNADMIFDVSNPGTGADLAGWWELDEGDSNVANDSSTYANHGTVEGDYLWVADHNEASGGFALRFRNDGGRVRVPDAPILRPSTAVTAAAWVNYSEPWSYSARVVVKGADENNSESYALQLDDDRASWFIRSEPNGDNLGVEGAEGEVDPDEWVHLAGTYDGNTVKCYVNGRLSDSEDVGTVTILSDTNDLCIGNREDANNRALIGKVDDARVYNRALLETEIAWLATDGTGLYLMQSPANLYDEEDPGERAVNFRDYAVLLIHWLEEQLWPE